MHRFMRPSPLSCAAAGGLCTAGLAGIIARAVDAFTSYNLAHPFDVVTFVVGVVGTITGCSYVGYLTTRNLKHQIHNLKAENERLRADRASLRDLTEAVRKADAQGEVNGVRINKLTRIIERQNAEADTQPIATLHSIRGA